MPRVMRSKTHVRDELVKLIDEMRVRDSYGGPDPHPASTQRLHGAAQALAWVLDAKRAKAPSKGPQDVDNYFSIAEARNLARAILQATKTSRG